MPLEKILKVKNALKANIPHLRVGRLMSGPPKAGILPGCNYDFA